MSFSFTNRHNNTLPQPLPQMRQQGLFLCLALRRSSAFLVGPHMQQWADEQYWVFSAPLCRGSTEALMTHARFISKAKGTGGSYPYPASQMRHDSAADPNPIQLLWLSLLADLDSSTVSSRAEVRLSWGATDWAGLRTWASGTF